MYVDSYGTVLTAYLWQCQMQYSRQCLFQVRTPYSWTIHDGSVPKSYWEVLCLWQSFKEQEWHWPCMCSWNCSVSKVYYNHTRKISYLYCLDDSLNPPSSARPLNIRCKISESTGEIEIQTHEQLLTVKVQTEGTCQKQERQCKHPGSHHIHDGGTRASYIRQYMQKSPQKDDFSLREWIRDCHARQTVRKNVEYKKRAG